jgi:biopolymer transport protein ExbD
MTGTQFADPMLDMNTTPLIDVMLVLLVMFIITVPIQSHAVKLDLPRPQPGPIVNPVRNLVEITPVGTLLWNGSPITETGLAGALAASRQLPAEPELHLRPAPEARYGAVDRVLAIIKREQVGKLGFVGNERYAAG